MELFCNYNKMLYNNIYKYNFSYNLNYCKDKLTNYI